MWGICGGFVLKNFNQSAKCIANAIASLSEYIKGLCGFVSRSGREKCEKCKKVLEFFSGGVFSSGKNLKGFLRLLIKTGTL